MEFNLIKTKFIKRYKRFLMDLKLGNKLIIAHTPNTGSMKTLLDENNFVYVEKFNNPNRKLKYTTQIIEFGNKKNKFCLINTIIPNKLIKSWILNNEIKEFNKLKYKYLGSEIKYGKNSRIDILLSNIETNSKVFIEIKNATLLLDDNICAFPDAITKRGLKHLDELINEVKQGNEAFVIFLVSRNDCDYFKIAENIDYNFYEKYLEAKKLGVKFRAYRIKFSKLKNKNKTYNFKLNFDKEIRILN
jgi:sugar fermentation stimulation protein A